MGNRHGGEKSAKEEKEEKKRKKKEKKAKKKEKKKTGAVGSDVDLDPESSQFSRADSESMVFHSAENLSPYLDASTRSEEGAACGGFYDNGHILSSKDFQDGFCIEACLPAELAASALMSDVTGEAAKVGDDVTSMASGVYSTPLLSSPDVRRGIPRSPLAQRQKDSFLEPVPPIPSDFSSNTLSSVSYQEGVSTPGTQRSSSRTSSSTMDTNAAHCIERLEELERNIERTINEKFAPLEQAGSQQGTPSENTTPRLARRAENRSGEKSREGSVTPKGVGSDGAAAQSAESSPTVVRKISEPYRPTAREGSVTPKGIIQGMWSQSAENSPVIVRKALPSPESPIIVRRTPSQSPTVERKFPANAPESPVFYRRAVTAADSPWFSPSTQRQGPADSHEKSPQLARKETPESEPSGVSPAPKAKVPPPVPPKPVFKTLTSPEIARRMQNMPKSPIMARKVYAFQEQAKDKNAASRDDPWDRSWREHQMPPKSPSRSPEVRHRVPRKTPSSSPSPKSLVRKLMPQEDRAPPPVSAVPSPPTPIQFCEQQRGIPVKHCIVAAHPSAAVVLDMEAGEDSVADTQDSTHTGPVSGPGEKPCTVPHQSPDTKHPHTDASNTQTSQSKDQRQEKPTHGDVSEDAIKKNTESAVFGSVSPKLKRQKKLLGSDDSPHGSPDPQRGDSTDSSTRSPPCSPPTQRGRPILTKTNINVMSSEESDFSSVSGSIDRPDQSPVRRRAQFHKQNSKCNEDGTLSADIAGGLTYHAHLPPDDVSSDPHLLTDQRSPEGQHGESAEYFTLPQDTGSAGRTGALPMDRKELEGYGDHYVATATSTTHVSQTTLNLAHSPQAVDTRETETWQRGAVIADSTVEKNARSRAGYADGEYCTDTAAKEERSRARGKESEQRVHAPCQRVPSPPILPGAAGSSVSRNLGQRIRDVINESTYREVFTAELSSSSSMERDDGTYTSDDSLFAHGAHRSPHHVPLHHRSHPPQGWEGVAPRGPGSPLSSPTTQPAARGRCLGGSTGGHTPPPYLSPGQSAHIRPPPPDSLPPHAPVSLSLDQHVPVPPLIDHHVPVSPSLDHHVPASPPLDSTAIRRIDIDVNVILPQGECQVGATAAPATQSVAPGNQCAPGGGGQGAERKDWEVMDSAMDPQQHTLHSSPSPGQGDRSESGAKTSTDKQDEADAGTVKSAPPTTLEKTKTLQQPVMEATHGEQNVLPAAGKNVSDCEKGDKHSKEVVLGSDSPSPLPSSAVGCQATYECLTAEQGESSAQGETADDSSFTSESKSRTDSATALSQVSQAVHKGNISQDSVKPPVPTNEAVSVHGSKPNFSSQFTASELSQNPQAHDSHLQDCAPSDTKPGSVQQNTVDSQHVESAPKDVVPPPSPTAMDTLAEEEEEEEGEDVDSLINVHEDSDISSKISQEMQLFGESVLKRLSSLLESQASESDSCLEESRTDLLTRPAHQRKLDEDLPRQLSGAADQLQTDSSRMDGNDEDKTQASLETASSALHLTDSKELGQRSVAPPSETSKDDVEPVLHEELNTFSASDLPGERLVTSDTTETLSTDQDTSASSKRESTASTATDETLTSFKTRSTTDSAEFEEAFLLPESLVFVRSVNEGAEGEGAVVETGRIVKRPPIPAELNIHTAASETTSHKPRKKRRRQMGTPDVSARPGVTEPKPKRGSKEIQEVIDAYCDEMNDDSDIRSSTDDILSDEVVHKTTYSRSEQQARVPTSVDHEHSVKDIARKPKPPADRSTDSSDESVELEGKRQSSSSHDSSFRIPEIEETFGELMGVKTFLEDLEDKTPTSEPLPMMADEEKLHSKESMPSAHSRRRSKTSPARTDRTESDLDVSEHRDDASSDSMYADDEDEGTEVVFQRSYSEEHGGEVVLSCTIYNSSHDNDGDSDDFWADTEAAEAAVAADESYKSLETAADAAGSAFQNARIQMHDIHQHLQDLRRQMELLQDDITSTSLTLTPEYSLESEQRPVTE